MEPPDPEAEPSLEERLGEAEGKIVGLKEQLLRMAADFDNYRKRARREAEDAMHSGRESLLKDILPVFDNLERAALLSKAVTAKTADLEVAPDVVGFVNGIEMVLRQFTDTLKRIGIERVAGVGTAFDPSVHEAIQQLETSQYEPGMVAAEVQGGYRHGDRLIRPALVVVAKRPSNVEAASGDAAGMSEEAPN